MVGFSFIRYLIINTTKNALRSCSHESWWSFATEPSVGEVPEAGFIPIYVVCLEENFRAGSG